MYPITTDQLRGIDLCRQPVEVAERVWWVGHVQDNDPFQSHVYLIEQGDQSVLLDPGSKLTFRNTLAKIEQVLPFSRIRYFVCHHQDPDIAAALPLVDRMVTRPDAVVVTHWRTKALLRHYALRMPFWLVDEHDWVLPLEDRSLRFVFTPYAHFPGSICSFDERSQALFSSDLFGGFTPEFSLVAKDEGYFEAMRPFHEHYMPSRDILGYAMSQIEQHPVRVILPQHGSIIPEPLVAVMIAKLKALECGLYLTAGDNTDFQRLSRLNQTLQDIVQAMVVSRDFREIAARLLDIARRLLPVRSMEYFARLEDGQVLHLSPENRYRGKVIEPPERVAACLASDRRDWQATRFGDCLQSAPADADGHSEPSLLLPLFSPESGTARAVCLLRLSGPMSADADVQHMIRRMEVPLQVAVDREVIYRSIEMERQRFYERSVRDALTGLYTRLYMQDTVQRLMEIQDRDETARVGLILLDIDHFKAVNDHYGHNQGDQVLRQVAAAILSATRGADVPVRLGGEEFAVFVVGQDESGCVALAERIRLQTAALSFAGQMRGLRVTFSLGVTLRRHGESLTELIERADRALFEAKNGGRNQVRVA